MLVGIFQDRLHVRRVFQLCRLKFAVVKCEYPHPVDCLTGEFTTLYIFEIGWKARHLRIDFHLLESQLGKIQGPCKRRWVVASDRNYPGRQYARAMRYLTTVAVITVTKDHIHGEGHAGGKRFAVHFDFVAEPVNKTQFAAMGRDRNRDGRYG